ncbi:hypothetical protein C8R48DRAFT_672786 [Suillus tomentosus]|nr:hypothetical protein C8R48DRAFT_672786 [Suillus tomentosus]
MAMRTSHQRLIFAGKNLKDGVPSPAAYIATFKNYSMPHGRSCANRLSIQLSCSANGGITVQVWYFQLTFQKLLAANSFFWNSFPGAYPGHRMLGNILGLFDAQDPMSLEALAASHFANLRQLTYPTIVETRETITCMRTILWPLQSACRAGPSRTADDGEFIDLDVVDDVNEEEDGNLLTPVEAVRTVPSPLQTQAGILLSSELMATGKSRPTPLGTGNTGTRAPTPTNRIRASHRNTVSLLLTRDEIMLQEYDVKDKESSVTFLEKSPFRHLDEPMSNESLILTILHITQYTGIPRTAIEGLRAVTILLKDNLNNTQSPTSTTQQLAESLTTSLSAQVVADLSSSLSAHVIAAISPQIASILTTSESLKSNVEKLEKFKLDLEATSENTNTTTSASAAATRVEKAADAVLNSISDVKNALLTVHPPSNQPNGALSYSAAV